MEQKPEEKQSKAQLERDLKDLQKVANRLLAKKERVQARDKNTKKPSANPEPEILHTPAAESTPPKVKEKKGPGKASKTIAAVAKAAREGRGKLGKALTPTSPTPEERTAAIVDDLDTTNIRENAVTASEIVAGAKKVGRGIRQGAKNLSEALNKPVLNIKVPKTPEGATPADKTAAIVADIQENNPFLDKELDKGPKKTVEVKKKDSRLENAQIGDVILDGGVKYQLLEFPNESNGNKPKVRLLSDQTIPVTNRSKEVNTKTPDAAVEQEVKKEIENLPTEEKEKLGWGLRTIGFKAETVKNNIFATIFGGIANTNMNQNSAVTKFCKELQDGFIRDTKAAEEKAKNISGMKGQAINTANLLRNVFKYGRILTDLTGKSLASPFRYVMMAGAVTARGSEAAKEVRFKNENLIDKTRIQDAEKAAEEAWAIHERALGKAGDEGVSAEALKQAYLLEMPKNITKKIKDSSVGYNIMQGVFRQQITHSMSRLDKAIKKIEANPKMAGAKGGEAKNKLLKKWEKSLADYDRALTDVGIVDTLAMSGRYGEKLGKIVVAGATAETIFLSAEKLYEYISRSLIEHDIHDGLIKSVNIAVGKLHDLMHHTEQNLNVPHGDINLPHEVGHSAVVVEKFSNDGIKFEHGKGAIKGISDLKHQLTEKYHGDFSKAPKSVQDFMNTDAKSEAIKLGLYDPNALDGKESALIQEGSVLKFDEHGNLLFGKPDASGHIATLEKYHGAMLDSDGSAKVTATPEADQSSIPQEAKDKIFKGLKFGEETPDHKGPMHGVTFETHTPTAEEVVRAKLDTQYSAGDHVENIINNRPHTGSQQLIGGTPPGEYHSGGPSTFGFGKQLEYYPDLSKNDNMILQTRPEFAANYFHLTGKQLKNVYDTSKGNLKYLFGGEDSSTWTMLRGQKANIVMEHADLAKSDETYGKMVSYLRVLKNFSGLKPKGKILGMFGKTETIQTYIARALQKLTASGKLDDFEASIRK